MIASVSQSSWPAAAARLVLLLLFGLIGSTIFSVLVNGFSIHGKTGNNNYFRVKSDANTALWGTTLDDEDEYAKEERRQKPYGSSGEYDYSSFSSSSFSSPLNGDGDDFLNWEGDYSDPSNGKGDYYEREGYPADQEDGKFGPYGNNASPIHDEIDALNQKLNRQQKQIERLIQTIQDLAENSPQPDSKSNNEDKGVVPIKAMLFIDGTWLYYSLFEREYRRDPIRKQYGNGWYQRYKFDFHFMPTVICEALKGLGWSSGRRNRPIEIMRACVFTSYRADTRTDSARYRLFEDMKAANYDVHQITTVGKSEKCIDIQLAVELLHYATIPDAFDVAIVLTGDMDFLPALVRTRQKGRKVALVSMRAGCNLALREANGIKDYDIVWLEDHLDKLFVPKDPSEIQKLEPVSLFTVCKVLKDFIDQSGRDRVLNRDMGRYLQCLAIGDNSLLDSVKSHYGILTRLIGESKMFDQEELTAKGTGSGSGTCPVWVRLRPEADKVLLDMAQNTELTLAEKKFFDEYDTSILKDRTTAYYYSMKESGEPVGAEPVAMMVNPSRLADFSSFSMSPFTLNKVLKDFVDGSKMGAVGSRDVGRYLQTLKIGDKTLLALLKTEYGGLSPVISYSDIFERIEYDEADSHSFWIQARPGANKRLLEMAKNTTFSEEEKNFFRTYDPSILQEDPATYYLYTMKARGDSGGAPAVDFDFSSYTVAELRERCRQQGLPTTGLKAVLLERVMEDAKQEAEGLKAVLLERVMDDAKQEAAGLKAVLLERVMDDAKQEAAAIQSSGLSHHLTPSRISHNKMRLASVSPEVQAYLQDIVKEYLKAAGGEASSRNVGRYLAANNPSSAAPLIAGYTALQELKNEYGGLLSFLNCYPELFSHNYVQGMTVFTVSLATVPTGQES